MVRQIGSLQVDLSRGSNHSYDLLDEIMYIILECLIIFDCVCVFHVSSLRLERVLMRRELTLGEAEVFTLIIYICFTSTNTTERVWTQASHADSLRVKIIVWHSASTSGHSSHDVDTHFKQSLSQVSTLSLCGCAHHEGPRCEDKQLALVTDHCIRRSCQSASHQSIACQSDTFRKFGKQIQKRQLEIPEYAASFVDYKALKKVRQSCFQ